MAQQVLLLFPFCRGESSGWERKMTWSSCNRHSRYSWKLEPGILTLKPVLLASIRWYRSCREWGCEAALVFLKCVHFYPDIEVLFLGWVLDGHYKYLFLGGKERGPGRLMFMNFKSDEMSSFLQSIWDAVQKRPNRANLRQLPLEMSAFQGWSLADIWKPGFWEGSHCSHVACAQHLLSFWKSGILADAK